MRKKKVWRYYCDFCKKANCSGASIKKHESRCTLNPDRTCGMCALLDSKQPDVNAAMDLLPNPKDHETLESFGGHVDDALVFYEGLDSATEQVMTQVRNTLNNCPACIMSALRRKGIPLTIVQSFSFTDESKAVWAEFNHNQVKDEVY